MWVWMLGLLAFLIYIPWIYSNKHTISYFIVIGIVAFVVLGLSGHGDAAIYLLIAYAIFFFVYTKGVYDGKWITKKHLREDIENDGYAYLEGMTICNQNQIDLDSDDFVISNDPEIKSRMIEYWEGQASEARERIRKRNEGN